MQLNLNPGIRVIQPNQRILDLIRRILMRTPNLPPAPPPAPPPPPRLNVRVCGMVVSGANADIARFRRDLDQARAVWGQCGIDFTEGSFTTINADLDYPNWVDYATRPTALENQRGNCGANDIRVFYVRSIQGSTFQGRTIRPGGEAGYVALSNDAHPNLFPHELGHIFLGGNEWHRDGSSPADLVNIMRSDVGTIQGPPQVDQNQCARARSMVPGVQGLAALALGLAPPPPVFGSSPEEIVRQLLVAVGNRIDPVVSLGQAIVPQLITIVTSDPDAIIRTRAAAALGRIGGAQATVTLIRACADPDPLVRAISTVALGRVIGR